MLDEGRGKTAKRVFIAYVMVITMSHLGDQNYLHTVIAAFKWSVPSKLVPVVPLPTQPPAICFEKCVILEFTYSRGTPTADDNQLRNAERSREGSGNGM